MPRQLNLELLHFAAVVNPALDSRLRPRPQPEAAKTDRTKCQRLSIPEDLQEECLLWQEPKCLAWPFVEREPSPGPKAVGRAEPGKQHNKTQSLPT